MPTDFSSTDFDYSDFSSNDQLGRGVLPPCSNYTEDNVTFYVGIRF